MISTSDAGRQASASARYPGARLVDTPADILELAGELDLLVLGTPPATHYPLAKAALEAGLDVVVDKPFTVRSAEGEELIQLAARLGRVLTVFQNRRWDGDYLTVQGLLERGVLGTVTRFESRFERWSPEVAKAWKAAATADDGGGVLFDLGTHLLDQAVQLFGPATVTHAELGCPAARRDDRRRRVPGAAARIRRDEPPVDEHALRPAGAAVPAAGHRGRLHQKRRGPAGALHRGRRQPAGPGLWGRRPGLGRAAGPGRPPGPASHRRGAYPEFYRLLAAKIHDGGTASALPVPVDPAGPVEVLQLIEQARALAKRA